MASAGTIFSNFKTPEPNWTLCHSYDHFEVRQYEPMIWASIKVNEKEYNKAFMSLAKYIWGENHLPTDPTKSEKINMMVPVFQHSSDDNIMMSFVLPPKYKAVEEVPIPNNPMIQIHLMDPLIVAVHQFNGKATESTFEEHRKQLMEYIKEEEVQMEDPLVSYDAQYNPPWTIPYFRRNEVWIQVHSCQE